LRSYTPVKAFLFLDKRSSSSGTYGSSLLSSLQRRRPATGTQMVEIVDCTQFPKPIFEGRRSVLTLDEWLLCSISSAYAIILAYRDPDGTRHRLQE
jgi:hypothetical protein